MHSTFPPHIFPLCNLPLASYLRSVPTFCFASIVHHVIATLLSQFIGSMVCDPPYGVRAGGRKSHPGGRKGEVKEVPEALKETVNKRVCAGDRDRRKRYALEQKDQDDGHHVHHRRDVEEVRLVRHQDIPR